METLTRSTQTCAGKIKLFSGPGTRRWLRFSILEIPSIRSIRSSTGSEIQVANISRGGVLLRTRRRLSPHTRIQLNIETDEKIMPLGGVVLRSSIGSLKDVPRYQAAIAFDSPLCLLDEPMPPIVKGCEGLSPIPHSAEYFSDILESLQQPAQHESSAVISSFLALSSVASCHSESQGSFVVNNW